MSAVDQIVCDDPDCTATGWVQNRWFPTVTASEGWQIGWDSIDYCPDHATEPGPPIPPDDFDPEEVA